MFTFRRVGFLALLVVLVVLFATPAFAGQSFSCPATPQEASDLYGGSASKWTRVVGYPEDVCGWIFRDQLAPLTTITVPSGSVFWYWDSEDFQTVVGPATIKTNYGDMWNGGEVPAPNLQVLYEVPQYVGIPFTVTFSADFGDEFRVYANPLWIPPTWHSEVDGCTRWNSNMWLNCRVGATVTNTLTVTPTNQGLIDLEFLVTSDFFNGVIAQRRIFIQVSPPLAVNLANFQAAAQGDGVLVTWETVSEVGNVGFNLYRNITSTVPAEPLTFVPSSAPGSTQGASYSYADTSVTAGDTYWYWLEDVSTSGATTLHGPVSATTSAPTAVDLVTMVASSSKGCICEGGGILSCWGGVKPTKIRKAICKEFGW